VAHKSEETHYGQALRRRTRRKIHNMMMMSIITITITMGMRRRRGKKKAIL